MTYTQVNRRIAIETPLGPDALLLHSFRGREAISRSFEFQLELLSENDAIAFDQIVGQRVSVKVLLADGAPRYWNGFVSRFSQAGRDQHLAIYQAAMVPWLWFLTRTSDCRIFQQKTAPEIIQQVFKEAGFNDFAVRLYGNFAPRDYCVQYRETDFTFVSRLMEEEGIFYFFEHEENKHVLVLANDPAAHKPCPEQPSARYELSAGGWQDDDVIYAWHQEQEFRPGVYSATDYNFETPESSLAASVNGKSKYELYDYPGEYRKRSEGDGIVRIRLEEQEMTRVVARGTSDCRAFTTGYRFELEDHYRKDLNQAYVLSSVHHDAKQGSNYGSGEDNEEVTYSNAFECIPASTPFRPPRTTPAPVVRGCQTAVVVGPAGEEIYTDKYGRVKVQFHWDREGKRNDSSSCWIRVASPWAGKGWGGLQIPRIGQEVIVDFLEGDPDQPIIIGRVYNAGQMPPFGMPGGANISGFKSSSTKGGGGYNEFSFDDSKGKELINVHGQYDLQSKVEHDERATIGNDRTRSVGHDESVTVENNRTVTVNGTHTETIKGDTSIMVKEGTYQHKVLSKTADYTVQGAVTETFKNSHTTNVTDAITITSKSSHIHLFADEEQIMLRSGHSQILMKNDGTIEITGKRITINGSEEVTSQVARQSITCNRQTVHTQGAKINTTAVGMHEISGALIKIN
jgi:type VI secretion system secreted protein VgrG